MSIIEIETVEARAVELTSSEDFAEKNVLTEEVIVQNLQQPFVFDVFKFGTTKGDMAEIVGRICN